MTGGKKTQTGVFLPKTPATLPSRLLYRRELGGGEARRGNGEGGNRGKEVRAEGIREGTYSSERSRKV